jgi:hypothetical protein
MISYYGVSNSALQKAIIDLCFYDDNSGVRLIDEGIVNDTLSGEQLRMLPMIYVKSDLNHFSLFARSRIKGMYKHTLCRNHSLLLSGIEFQKKIHAAGYKKVIFLKGVAHLLYAKKNFGQRPMADIDILVPNFIVNIEKSMAFIKDEDYEIKSFGVREISVTDKNKNEFDIHWYLNHGALKKSTVDKIFARSVTINYLGNQILVPCYEHQLAHLIIHGIFAPTLTYDARWIVDVVDLLSLNEEINTDIFLEFIEDTTLPCKVKYAIDLILNNIDSELKFDRKALEYISRNIQLRNNILKYFYNQKPRPNVIFTDDNKSYSWIKSGICTHIIEPMLVARFNNCSFFKSLSLTFGFPPPPIRKVFYLMLNKIYQRLFHRAKSIILK